MKVLIANLIICLFFSTSICIKSQNSMDCIADSSIAKRFFEVILNKSSANIEYSRCVFSMNDKKEFLLMYSDSIILKIDKNYKIQYSKYKTSDLDSLSSLELSRAIFSKWRVFRETIPELFATNIGTAWIVMDRPFTPVIKGGIPAICLDMNNYGINWLNQGK